MAERRGALHLVLGPFMQPKQRRRAPEEQARGKTKQLEDGLGDLLGDEHRGLRRWRNQLDPASPGGTNTNPDSNARADPDANPYPTTADLYRPNRPEVG